MKLLYASTKIEKNYRLIKNQDRRETSNILVFKVDKEEIKTINKIQDIVHTKVIYGENGMYYITCNVYDILNILRISKKDKEDRLSIKDMIVEQFKINLISSILESDSQELVSILHRIMITNTWYEREVYTKEEIREEFSETIAYLHENVSAKTVLVRSNSIDELGLIEANNEIYYRFKTKEKLGSQFANKLINLSFRVTMSAKSLIPMIQLMLKNSLIIQDIDHLEDVKDSNNYHTSDYYTMDVVGSIETYSKMLRGNPRGTRIDDGLFMDQVEDILSSYRVLY